MRIKDLGRDPSLPVCKHCNIPMDIHKTMSGDQYICDNYHICGGRLPIEKKTTHTVGSKLSSW